MEVRVIGLFALDVALERLARWRGRGLRVRIKRSGFLEDFRAGLLWTLRFREFFVEAGDALEATDVLIAIGPLDEEDTAFLADLRVDSVVSGHEAEAF